MRHEFRVMLSDPSTVIFVVLIPLLMVAIMKELFATALRAQGYESANGSEFGIPAMAVAFAAFGVGYAGFTFFRDHGWGTWDRLRATPVSSVDIMVGKVVPNVMITVVQLLLLFGLGGPLFGLVVTGSWLALIVLILVLAVSLSAFGMLVTSVARTMNQLNAVGSVGGMGLALLGGAWVPVETMPGWAQAIAPAMPTYWAMEGFRKVILESGGLDAVLVPSLVMLGFGVLFTVLSAWRFRFEETKVYYG
ncbi:ABC transporter permease [Nocardioides gansuensis]|uniref:Transport permease protein n=1 Tax=Nocardioides gansuensis TaxID=2138300 RepID=A0A2T8FDV1_9ACTN|nr:ABC transporter permease [Nocardioides gansuensis]PVG83869.1 ABC transporter permease [Nocardioides gansuensis]